MPLVVFAVVAGIVSVALDIWQDLSGFGVGVLPFAALGPTVGALVAWAANRRIWKSSRPAPVAQRQVIAHLVLGITAALVLVGLMLGMLAIQGYDLASQGGADSRIPFGITIGGIILAAALQEFGVRGFAQPILELTGSRLFATILVGLVWGFWVVQMFPMQDTVLAVGSMVLAAAAFSVLLGYLGNGSIGQRLGVTIVVHAIVASALTYVAGGGVTTEPLAIAFLGASVITAIVFMGMFVAAQRRRARRKAEEAAAPL